MPPGGTALTPLAGHLAAATAGGVAPAPPKELVKIHVSSGHSKRVGRWTVPSRMDLDVGSGHVLVDFTQAVITQPTLHIDAEVRSGRIILVTKPGIAVDLDDVSVRSGSVKVRAPWGDRVPAFLRVTVAGTCGSGAIVARPRRRSLWQWLRRAPRPYELTA